MKSKIEKKLNTVYQEDARKLSEYIPDDSRINTTITSPPYFDMKDYNSENQIGFGQTYEEYLNDLKSIFSQIYEKTESDGTLWIIIDTFKRNNQVVTLPFDLSNKLKECGWLLQDVIIWKKDKTVPWSSKGFMQRKFEYILFFSKTNNFKSNKDNVRVYDTSKLKKWWVKYPERYNPKGKALDEVWEFPIPIQGSWGEKYIRHFCPLPKEMVATMIEISSDKNDIVFDPFAGSGTVLSQSAYMNRNYIGFELNPEYIETFRNYLRKTLKQNKKEYKLLENSISQDKFEKNILKLRALKFGRLLFVSLNKKLKLNPFKIFVDIEGDSEENNKLIKVRFEFIGEFNRPEILEEIKNLISVKPLSKFGIEPTFKFLKKKKIIPEVHYGYTKTNSYSFNKSQDLESSKICIVSEICVDLNENDYL
jgi:DNA modification methylase